MKSDYDNFPDVSIEFHIGSGRDRTHRELLILYLRMVDTKIMSLVLVFLMGLSIGSFLNVLIDRLPKGQTILGRSKCDHCKKTLSWYELIPVVSWVIQAARCCRCHKPISIQYPIVELATGIGFVFLDPKTIIVFCSLLVIFVADFKYQIIPDSMLLAALIGGKWGYFGAGVGAAAFFLFLWLITGGRGMGLGDVKLVFVLGVLLGFPGIVVALYAAFLTGAAVGVILILVQKARLKTKIAFGPFLILGAVISYFYEAQIIAWVYPP